MTEQANALINLAFVLLLVLFFVFFISKFRLSGLKGIRFPSGVEEISKSIFRPIPADFHFLQVFDQESSFTTVGETIDWSGGWGGGTPLKLSASLKDIYHDRPGVIWAGKKGVYFRYSVPAVDVADQYIRIGLSEVVRANEGEGVLRRNRRSVRIWVTRRGTLAYYEFIIPASRFSSFVNEVNSRSVGHHQPAPPAEDSAEDERKTTDDWDEVAKVVSKKTKSK